MASKTLNQGNLEALGAARLAELLLEIAADDAAAKRRLRLELAGASGTAAVVREVENRLSTIAKARSFITWDKFKGLLSDLLLQRRTIVEQIGRVDAACAMSLLWRFLALADPLLNRCDDSDGRVMEVFHAAARDLAPLAVRAGVEPLELADRVFEALRNDAHGQYEALIEVLAAPLRTAGLQRLKALLTAWGAEAAPSIPEQERQVVGWGMGGKIYADQLEESHRRSAVQLGLQQVADALGDVDGFIAQYDGRLRAIPGIAAAIGARLVSAGRAGEALAILDAADIQADEVPPEWEQARLDALVALGRQHEAEAFRWERFLATLSPEHLRAHLKAQSPFDEFDVEEQAIAHAAGFHDAHEALAFLVQWPALEQAGRLVEARQAEFDGNQYQILAPAAEALEQLQPLAAVILYRAMVDDTLGHGRSSRYRHAMRHLQACARLAVRIGTYAPLADHEIYVGELRVAHGRKTGFWSA